jgi:hypothetical protein
MKTITAASRLYFMHFWAHNDALKLAAGLSQRSRTSIS